MPSPSDLPRSEITLPSLGKVYPANYLLHNKATVMIKSMGIDDEDILTSTPLINKNIALDEFVKSALGGNIDTDLMLVGDKEAIIHAFRATGYGTDYNVNITCTNPKCEETFEHTFDLSRLEINTLEANPVEPFLNLFALPAPLPMSGADILFSLMTVGMERAINEILENLRIKAKQRLIPTKKTTLKFQIKSVNGNSDKEVVGDFVDRMHAQDSKTIRAYIKQISPGVITKQIAKCDHCGHHDEYPLPMNVSFFFPEG